MKKAFLFRALIAVMLIGTCALVWGIWIEPASLRVRFEEMEWRGPALKVALVSDLHAGSPHIDMKYLEDLVAKVNEATPDLILLAGDYDINGIVGGGKVAMGPVASALGKLRAKHGVFAVLGNHDWWNDAEAIRKDLESHSIPVLENRSVKVSLEGSEVRIVGIGDDFTGHADLRQAMSEVEPDSIRILLTHDPAVFMDSEFDFDIALAGHLHGGQVQLPGVGPMVTPGRAPRKWAAGWANTAKGPVFVTNGVGTSIIPVRFGAPPEIAILKLRSLPK